jgi:F0F1-type ATP synthase assembly protein I
LPEENRGGDWARAWRDAAPFLGLGTSLAASILVGIWLGRYLDRQLDTEPTFFWVGAVLGMAAASWEFYRQVTKKK